MKPRKPERCGEKGATAHGKFDAFASWLSSNPRRLLAEHALPNVHSRDMMKSAPRPADPVVMTMGMGSMKRWHHAHGMVDADLCLESRHLRVGSGVLLFLVFLNLPQQVATSTWQLSLEARFIKRMTSNGFTERNRPLFCGYGSAASGGATESAQFEACQPSQACPTAAN
jgi:hypothetical protein